LVTTPATVAPPDGWLPHRFWHNFDLETQAHLHGLGAACVCLVLLVLARALLPPADRSRARLGIFFVAVYFVLFLVKAALLYGGLDNVFNDVQLASTVLIAWAIIGTAGLLSFDLVGARFGVPKILRDLSVTLASLVALVVTLSRSGVNLIPLITTSAVVTAVIGLAMQDTLGNLFSGIALQLESSISIGDWIKLDERSVGKVIEIRWRSTVIRTKNDDLIVIPNGMFAKGVITIFAKDELQNRRWVYFNVHLRHPPNLVQKIVVDALAGTPNVSTLKPPDCIVWRYHESWLEYAVRYRLVDFLPDDPTDSEIRKRIWYALHRENIEIPYPGYNLFVTELNKARAEDKAERERNARRQLLECIGLFRPLSDEERAQLAAGLGQAVFGAGEVVIRQGDPGNTLYIVRSGEVAVQIAMDNPGNPLGTASQEATRLTAPMKKREVARLGRGEFFGEMSLLTGEPRHATVVAKTDVECYVIERATFETILKNNESLAKQIGKLLSEREMKNKIERDGLSAEAAAADASHEALYTRIKSFFGL
jgi:small-conductance mechanosensitive channel/CRP-like cAMP-binding protein